MVYEAPMKEDVGMGEIKKSGDLVRLLLARRCFYRGISLSIRGYRGESDDGAGRPSNVSFSVSWRMVSLVFLALPCYTAAIDPLSRCEWNHAFEESKRGAVESVTRHTTALGTVRALTFAIRSGLPDFHPGILCVDEIQAGGSERMLHHSFFSLYELVETASADVGLLIAEAIYDDQLTPRQGRYKGPRFDFQSDCEICLVQKIGVDAGRPSRGGNARYTKTPIGMVRIPGGFPRDEICSILARTFNAGWCQLADEAYMRPSQIASETGEVLYNHYGRRFARVVRFESNFRQVIGPVVFFACMGERIVKYPIK